MRIFKFLVIVGCLLYLVGCATTGINTNSPNFNSTFTSGNLRLQCELACAGTAGANSQKKKQLYNNGLWPDLVREVAVGGQNSNIDYYYLGASAEALGYYDAAIVYYKLGLAANIKCSGSMCVGFVFPIEIYNRINQTLVKKDQSARQRPVQRTQSSALTAQPTAMNVEQTNSYTGLRYEDLLDGSVYRFSSNCGANCPSLDTLRRVCANMGGVAKSAFDALAKQSSEAERSTLLYGDLVAVKFSWNDSRNQCSASLKLKYTQNSSQPNVHVVGNVVSFGFNSNTQKFTAASIERF